MISKEEVSYDFELPGFDEIPDSVDKEGLLNGVADYLMRSILDYVGEAKTPVAGGSYDSTLSEKYANREKKGDTLANLDLNGDMLNALESIINYETGVISLGIFDSDQAIKAFNHNTGDTLPQRQFIPEEDQTFKAEILRGIPRIIQEYLEEEE
jgi:hypothetical protein